MIYAGSQFATSAWASGEQIGVPSPPPPPIVTQILDYYANLLILQYRSKDRARQTTRLVANQSVCGGFVFDEAVCFNLDTAIGAQLNILGRIVGVPRTVYTFDLNNLFFNFTSYTGDQGNEIGFGDYTDSPYDPDGFLFYSYNLKNAVSITLTDSDMRTLIRMKIELNNNRSTFAFIKDYIFRYLSTDVEVEDELDMTLTYTIQSSFGPLARAALFLGMLPVPAGVEANFVFV